MEEIIIRPTENHSSKANMVLYAKIECLNKKRKFPAEQLGLPLPKHKCSSSFALAASSTANQDELNLFVFERGSSGGSADDASQPSSGKYSNRFSGDVDSDMSLPAEFKSAMCYSEVIPSDQPSTSSANWDSKCFEKSLYTLESRSVTNLGSEKMESMYIDGDRDLLGENFKSHSLSNHKEHLLALGSYEDYGCAEYRPEDMERYTDKELEDLLLYSNGVAAKNYVLSSGRQTVNQDPEQGAKKLTIDKEFEEYFSMLML